jgi:hypothetical protein
MNTPVHLFEKDEFIFKKLNEKQYYIEFQIENNNFRLDKIVDFGLMKLTYDLNPDIYLMSSIEKINDNEVNVTLLLKHFFEDLGLPQRYSYVHMTKKVEENKIVFLSKIITDKRPDGIPEEAQLMAIDNLVCTCEIETQHKINFTFYVNFDKNRIVLPVPIEKIIGIILNKIFKRVKQFIENIQ